MSGKKQTKIDTALSLQLNKFAGQVRPVLADASGHNALDIILANHLGRAVELHPCAQFYIISKDKDFVPLIDHLQAQGNQVSRHDALAALPFLIPAKKSSTKPPLVTSAPPPVKPKASEMPKPVVDKLTRFITHLHNSPPANRTKLEHMITAYFKPSLPAGGMKGVIVELLKRNAVVIDDAGKVTCR